MTSIRTLSYNSNIYKMSLKARYHFVYASRMTEFTFHFLNNETTLKAGNNINNLSYMHKHLRFHYSKNKLTANL